MKLTFKTISIASTMLTASLFLLLMFVPGLIYWLFQIDGGASTDFISRRAAVMFLGLAILSWSGRNAPPSAARQAICIGMATMMFSLAALGFGEFITGSAGPGIMMAVMSEFAFAIAYSIVWRSSGQIQNGHFE